MKYKNYVFDLYGTLVDIHTDEEKTKVWEQMTAFFAEQGAVYETEELQKSYETFVKEEQEKYDEILVERIFERMYAQKNAVVDAAQIQKTCRYFRKITTEYIRLYPWSEKMLAKLKENGKKVYLLSNAQRSFTEPEIRELGIEPYFDHIFISSDHGVKKPNSAFFQVLLEQYQLDPKECLMVGNDEVCDMLGAKSVGMDTFYIHSNISPEYTGKAQPTYEVFEDEKQDEEIELP